MSAFLSANYTEYIGTKNAIKTTFPITHRGIPIFKRQFDASSSSVVSVASSSIFIPNHFFVSGEEIEYSYELDGINEPIGISTISIVGIGTTDKLPSKVFVNKINDSYISLSVSAEDSLKINPIIINFNSLGVGTSHYLRSKYPNKKVLVTIDNVIQTPIVSTSITTFIKNNISSLDSIIECDNVNEFAVSDILKIDNEIVRVESVGFAGTNNLFVKRGFMGSQVAIHSLGSTVSKLSGSFNIHEDEITFATPPFGSTPKTNPNDPSSIDFTGITTRSTFSGRVFIRSGVPNGTSETYSGNYIFDDISTNFTGITSSFALTVDGNSITNISEDNSILLLNNVIQFPSRNNIDRNYNLFDDGFDTYLNIENAKINQENYDINSTGLPVGGRIVSIGSSSGSGYQPLVVASGKANISSGSISSITIDSGGSGYRAGFQTVSVGIVTDNLKIVPIGYANVQSGIVTSVIIENSLSGLSTSNIPKVVFDYPVGYENIPLIYSSQSPVGIGTGAKVDIFVSNNGTVRNFVLKNNGYGYKVGDILTIPTEIQNSIIGIPTNTTQSFNEFLIYIEETYEDTFAGWSVGEFQILDSPQKYFNGTRTNFPIMVDGELKSIRTYTGSPIDIQSTLLVFYNDTLQDPGSNYYLTGGSIITFAEAPKADDKCEILFYRGTKDIDVVDVDILETIQIGDTLQIQSDEELLNQDIRLVKEIVAVDIIKTNNYQGSGISEDTNLLRPVKWCKMLEDSIIDGNVASKSRIINEPLIYPNTTIIQNVGIGTTALIYVENVKTFFDNKSENLDDKFKGKVEIISQVENKLEYLENVSYYGDFGRVTSLIPFFVGISSYPALAVTLSIDKDSALLNDQIVDDKLDFSSLNVGDYFTIKNSNVGYGLTTIDISGSIISTGSTFIDNVYQVYSLESIGETIFSSITVSGNVTYASPTILETGSSLIVDDGSELTIDGEEIRIITRVLDHNNINQDLSEATSSYYGDYSWGKLLAFRRPNPKSFNVETNDGSINLETSPVVRRSYPLKYSNYLL